MNNKEEEMAEATAENKTETLNPPNALTVPPKEGIREVGGMVPIVSAFLHSAMTQLNANRMYELLKTRRGTFLYQDFDRGFLSNGYALIYCLPALVRTPMLFLISMYVTFYYESLGAKLGMLAFFMAFAWSVDFFTDPIQGYISDMLRISFGRRRLFMVIGCIFYPVTVILLFTPPDLSDNGYSWWFGIIFCFYTFIQSLVGIPYQALGYELVGETFHRTKLYTLEKIIENIGLLFAAGLPSVFLVFMNECDCDHAKIDEEKHKECLMECSYEGNKDAFMICAIFFSVFYLFSMLLLTGVIRERAASQIPHNHPSFPTCLNSIWLNKPFKKIIPIVMLDQSILYIIFPFLPFFVQYVLDPMDACTDNEIYDEEIKCRPHYWIGFIVAFYVFGASLSLPFWMYAAKYLQKRKAWTFMSLLMIVPLVLIAVCTEGQMILSMFIFFIIGLCHGGYFLQRELINDVIEYDEFLTLRRNEGVLEAIIQLSPKIMMILVTVIPMTFFGILDYEKPKDGIPQDQEDGVIIFFKCFYIGVPPIFAFISMLLKRKVPIWDNGVTTQIGIRIEHQISQLRMEEKDRDLIHPITGLPYYTFIDEELLKDAIENFPKHIKSMEKEDYVKSLKCKVIIRIVIASILFVGFLILLIFTFNVFDTATYSFIPALSAVFCGIMLLLITYNLFRSRKINVILDDFQQNKPFIQRFARHYVNVKMHNKEMKRKEYMKKKQYSGLSQSDKPSK